MSIKRLLITGWGRVGKDEAGAFLGRITALRYAGSTSWAALPLMAEHLGLHPQLAWETRRARREEWKAACDGFRLHDQTLLVRRALETGEICAGLRDIVELQAVKEARLVDKILWITRPGTPKDPTVTFSEDDTDEIILNDGDLEKFHVILFEWAVSNFIKINRTKETENLLRQSKFYMWVSPWGTAPKPFVPLADPRLGKPFNVGDE